MARVSAKFWTAFFAILVVGAADFAGPLCRSAAAEQTNAANNDSWYSPITRGFSKMGTRWIRSHPNLRLQMTTPLR